MPNQNPPETTWLPIRQWTPNYLADQLELLQLIDLPVYQILQEHQPRLESVEIQSNNGQPILARIGGETIVSLVPDDALRQEFQRKLQNACRQKLPLVALAGVGYGSELDWIHASLEPLPNTIVLAMERDPLALLIALSLQDRRQQLLSGLITWVLGEPIGERLTAAIMKQALYLVFSNQIEIVLGSTARDDTTARIYVEAFQNAIREITPYCREFNQMNQRFTENQKRRADSPSHVWSSGTATEYTTTPILRALHRGLESAGLRSTFTSLPRGRARSLVEFHGLIEASPDTILVLNDPSRGYIPNGEFFRAVWVTDDPSFRKNLHALPRYDTRELVMYADTTYEPTLREQGANLLLHLPVFALLENEGQVRKELSYPIVFVGMTWNMEPFLKQLHFHDRDLLEDVYEYALSSNEGTSGLRAVWARQPASPSLLEAAKKLYALCGRTPNDPATMMAYIVYMLDVYRRRKRMADALLPMGLHVYGNKDWLSLLGDRFADRYHGFIPYENLGDLYYSAHVTVGIHSLQLPKAINIRDCDILRAGGCLLSDPVEEMGEETILPGRDCETAMNPEEFAEKARLLLANEDRRNELAHQGQNTILDRYLPCHRAPAIVEALKNT